MVEKTDKLLDVLKGSRKQTARGEAKTVTELAQILGQNRETVLKRLRKMHLDGSIKAVRVMRTNISGRMTDVPAYIFVEQPTKKKNSA